MNNFKNYSDFEKAKSACRLCNVGLVYNRVVLSDGCKENPSVLIIGEAPGADEIIEGKPFVGKAGKLLRSVLNNNGFRTNNALISNVIPCRPENNVFPQDIKTVYDCYNRWLKEEIILTKPNYILLLGSQSLKYVLGMTGITKLRGKFYSLELGELVIECMPTFHPSYVLRKMYMEEGKRMNYPSLKGGVSCFTDKCLPRCRKASR